MRARVVNDTEEVVRCAPGTKRDARALLQTDLDLFCEPHAEIGFLFSISRFGSGGRSAFVRVSGTTFACGFDAPVEEDALRAAAISMGIAALLVAIVAGVVLFERRRRKSRTATRPEPAAPPVDGELVEEEPPPLAHPPAVPAMTRGIEARGFAAVLDEHRAVIGALEPAAQRAFSSDFLAKVVNQTYEPVFCTLSARTRRGIVPIAPGSFRIHPQSAAAVTVHAPLRLPWRLRTLHLNMESASLRASAQADVPMPLGARIAIATASAAICIVAAIFAYRAMHPSIAAFAVPSRVLAGDSATASYSLGGLGRGGYAVLFDGRRIASGTIPSGSGSFTFSTSRVPGTYRVSLRISGPLGSAARALSLSAVARLTPLAAAISSLAVDPGIAPAGATIAVRYAATADSGSVSILGAGGIAIERAPYDRSGVSTMHAPPVDTPTQYQVALDVTRSGAPAHASVGLLVLPQALATPQPAPAVPAGMMTAAQLLRLPARVVSGHGFTIALLAHPANLSLSLANASGTTIESEAVGSGATSVRMLAPHAISDARYLIVARFSSGTADQVLLAPFTVYAR